MSKTDTDVIITEYSAQFKAEPFERPRWRVTGGRHYRQTLQRRRAWTVAAQFEQDPQPAREHIHPNILLDPNAMLVFVPDNPGSRYGHAVLIEQVAR